MSLHIESVIVRALSRIAPLIAQLEKRNRNLADQLDRASSSVLLNTSEGAYSQKANRTARYFNALGSARETEGVLDGAVAMGYVQRVEPQLAARLHHVTAVLVLLSRRG